MNEIRETIKARQVAVLLNYKTSKSVYQLRVRDNTFPAPFKLGRATLFFKDEIIAWQNKRIEEASQTRIACPHA